MRLPRRRRKPSGESDVIGLSGWLYTDLLLGLAVVFLVTVDFVAIGADIDQCQTVQVPDVTSVSFETARQELAARGLRVIDQGTRREGIGEGLVYEQSPQSGITVCSGSTIKIIWNPRLTFSPEAYDKQFTGQYDSLDGAASLGADLEAWIASEGIPSESFTNLVLVYGYYAPGARETEGTGLAKSYYARFVESCSAVRACDDLRPLAGGETQTENTRFFGTLGRARPGGVYVELFVVCPNKCKK
jgi:hypothetical protein